MDVPLPGIGHWDKQLKNPKVWHFNFRGPDVERLVAGRERILLDRFYNELSATPASIDDQTRDHYAALYALPGAIHDAFSGQYAAFAQDAIDNQKLVSKGKLTLPVLAIGGDHSYGAHLATEIGFAASNVRSAVNALCRRSASSSPFSKGISTPTRGTFCACCARHHRPGGTPTNSGNELAPPHCSSLEFQGRYRRQVRLVSALPL